MSKRKDNEMGGRNMELAKHRRLLARFRFCEAKSFVERARREERMKKPHIFMCVAPLGVVRTQRASVTSKVELIGIAISGGEATR